ncbi:hypothetical protein AB0N65_17050 [Paenarthrobacter sp. NPDC089322]|uniref:hypothetical protein n=1 Tax=Paenarthrobacter sp. NPDC089322 TaxID=3155065 RepID=UPI00344165F8
MTAQSNHPLYSSTPLPFRPLCEHCGADADLVIDRIEPHRTLSPEVVHVEYRCESCGSLRSHAATVPDVAEVLIRSKEPKGILQFGRHHLHCGVPMHTGPGRLHLISSEGSGNGDPELETYLNTRVLHCDECGFQMEIPD